MSEKDTPQSGEVSNGDEPASGFTKREVIAKDLHLALLDKLLSRIMADTAPHLTIERVIELSARDAVRSADALLAELNKPQGE